MILAYSLYSSKISLVLHISSGYCTILEAKTSCNLSLNNSSSMNSPIRIPIRSYLSTYVGPIPFLVVPILLAPRLVSWISSISK